ncbi:MAG TPA: hypothetical protein VK250_01760 [Nitrososphaeraceae archaeon]|nr:hypothetical protein [Nitrososphaeraceae archaeon]
MLFTNLIYLWLEGTLSNVLMFYHSESLTIVRIAIDLQVQLVDGLGGLSTDSDTNL